MKRYIIFFILALFTLGISAQTRGHNNRRPAGKISLDIHDNLQYENKKGFTASLSKDIFDNHTYKDSNGNEIIYSKELWPKFLGYYQDDEYELFYWLIDSHQRKTNNKESYKIDIFGALQYQGNDGLNASLSKDVFDNKIYQDSRGNKVSYSKEFWPEIYADFHGDEINILYWLLDRFWKIERYQEEYSVDIFDSLKFKNNKNNSASLSKDVFDNKVYKDSNGNDIKYKPSAWNKIIKKNGSEQKAFISLIYSHLLNLPNE
ncbi:hypothetical protein [Dysgonomonas sp. ZJ709]|uniref:hypothetical protein n=1 Tax=Dysgonomonas sp. ZJ709 TaxID=2709797 RepID=UPI0013E9FFAF|nr:hypothetical protein [Dysgonomonas sp. ZJ709]